MQRSAFDEVGVRHFLIPSHKITPSDCSDSRRRQKRACRCDLLAFQRLERGIPPTALAHRQGVTKHQEQVRDANVAVDWPQIVRTQVFAVESALDRKVIPKQIGPKLRGFGHEMMPFL